MRVSHRFAPFTIEIDSQEDKEFIVNLTCLALKHLESKQSMFGSPSKKDMDNYQEINHFLNKIRGN